MKLCINKDHFEPLLENLPELLKAWDDMMLKVATEFEVELSNIPYLIGKSEEISLHIEAETSCVLAIPLLGDMEDIIKHKFNKLLAEYPDLFSEVLENE